MFILGLAHIAFGLIRFKAPLAEALADGFINQFRHSEARRAAFWFLMCGVLLILVGHLGLRAVAAGDPGALKTIAFYALGASAVGIAAFPASPLWSLLVRGLALLAV
ncbi:MAG: hypothetical protein CFE45_00935 [Burkholderiales bacterium PBB5]|nr:MAG: hypothetical protein CFE45_00935 [Burkholderiales bacterium PBB5]